VVPNFPVDVLPLPPEDLVGREALLNDLAARVMHHQSVLIPGPRRVGKSAIAWELMRRLAAEAEALTAGVDLFECGDVRELARKLTAALLAQIDPRWRRWEIRADRALAEGLRNSELTVSVLGLDLLRWVYRIERLETAEVLDRVLELPSKMGERLRRPVMVVFDEFQELTILDPTFAVFKRMRAHWQRQSNVAYVFLGSQATLVRRLFTTSRMPLYRFADIVPLPPISAEDWVSYIVGKFRKAGFSVSEGTARELVERTGGHPYDTMKVLQAVARRCALSASRLTVDRDLVWQGYIDAARDLARYFETEVKALDIPMGRAMLRRLATGQGTYVPGVSPSQNKKCADALVDQGILERPRPRVYRFVEPMLAEYLAGDLLD
jgi:hypothetical protein